MYASLLFSSPSSLSLILLLLLFLLISSFLYITSAGGVREACRSGSAGATGGFGATSPSCRSSCGASAAGATSHSPLPPLSFWLFPLWGCGSGSFPLTTPSGKAACPSQGCLHSHCWDLVQDCPPMTPFGHKPCLCQSYLLECHSVL